MLNKYCYYYNMTWIVIILCHILFLGLWSRLSAISVNNSVLATLHVLADHAELLTAAIQLRNLTSTNNQLLQVFNNIINNSI